MTVAGTSSFSDHVDIADNKQLRFGGTDFKIEHNTNENYIDSNSGHIYIRANVNDDEGDNIYIQPKSGENSAVFIHDGAVQLYYNDVKTFETTNEGVTLDTNSSSTILRLNSNTDAVSMLQAVGNDLYVKAASSGSIYMIGNGNETKLSIYSNGKLATNGAASVDCGVGGLHLYLGDGARNDYSTAADGLIIEKNGNTGLSIDPGSSGIANIYFPNESNHSIASISHNNSTGEFRLRGEDHVILATNGNTERLRITSDGVLYLGPYKTSTSSLNVPYEIRVAPYGWGQSQDIAAISMGNHSGATGSDDGQIVFKTAYNAHTDANALKESLRINSFGRLMMNHTQTSTPLNDTFLSIYDANSDASAIRPSGVS